MSADYIDYFADFDSENRTKYIELLDNRKKEVEDFYYKITKRIRLSPKFNTTAKQLYQGYNHLSSGYQGMLQFIIEWQRFIRLNKFLQNRKKPMIDDLLKPLFIALTDTNYDSFTAYTRFYNQYYILHAQLSWFVAYTILRDNIETIQTCSIYWKLFEDSYKRKINDKSKDEELNHLRTALCNSNQFNWSIKEQEINIEDIIDFEKC